MANPFETMYKQIPIVTRTYFTLAILTMLACHLGFLSPYQLFFDWILVARWFQVWRLVTCFLYFGTFGLNFVFHMFFMVRYARLLEEGSFRNSTPDFFFMVLFCGALMTCVAPFIELYFLGPSLAFVFVYIWARRNEGAHMNFLGLFTFTAPYLPFILVIFSLLLGSSIVSDLVGVAVGHVYYFLEDVYPQTSGYRLLATPRIIRALFQGTDPTGFPGAGRPVGT